MKKIPQRFMYNFLDAIGNSIVITNKKNHIVYVNRHYTEVTGYTLDEVIGKNPNVLSSGRQDQVFYKKLWISLSSTGYWEGEIWNRKKSGEIFPEWINISVVKDNENHVLYYLGIFSDITNKKAKEERIIHYAYYDPLTDLPNRRFFIEQLRQLIRLSKRNRQKTAVFFIDLDDFKPINDQHGHYAGDLYLCEFARVIKSHLRASDIVSRFGGDEFVVQLQDIKSKEQTILYAQNLLSSIRKTSIHIGDSVLTFKASLGYAVYPDDALQAEALIECADRRMYEAKVNKQR